MAHEVEFSIPTRELGKADVEFSIKKDGSKLGILRISKGSVVWISKDHSYGRKLSWADFAALMEEHGNESAEKR